MTRTLHSPEQSALVKILRRIREETGLRQVDLAERLERPQSFVSKYEAGERRLDLVELRAIAHELGTDLPRLVDRFERELGRRPRRRR